MGAAHQTDGLAEKAELHQGAQLCKVLPLFAHGGDWELARGATRDPQLQRCRALSFGLRRQRSPSILGGAERNRTRLPVLLPPSSPSPEPCQPPRKGPQTLLRCARACAGSSYLLACLQFLGSDLMSALSFQLIGRQRPRGVWFGAIRLLLAPVVVFFPRQ